MTWTISSSAVQTFFCFSLIKLQFCYCLIFLPIPFLNVNLLQLQYNTLMSSQPLIKGHLTIPQNGILYRNVPPMSGHLQLKATFPVSQGWLLIAGCSTASVLNGLNRLHNWNCHGEHWSDVSSLLAQCFQWRLNIEQTLVQRLSGKLLFGCLNNADYTVYCHFGTSTFIDPQLQRPSKNSSFIGDCEKSSKAPCSWIIWQELWEWHLCCFYERKPWNESCVSNNIYYLNTL